MNTTTTITTPATWTKWRPKFSDRFCANLWFDKAMEWMGEQADASQPFFAYIALNTPHSPFHALPKDFALYRDKVEDPLLAHFFGLIHNIDENYARLDRWLADRGLRDNTLVVFMNDNGTSKGETVFNAGMRGKKGSPYDGGHRAICFLRWPAAELGGPRNVGYAAHVTDILPTLIDLLGLEPPTGARFDGSSLGLVLTGGGEDLPDRKIVVQYGGRIRPKQYALASVVWNQWRLVGAGELYDLASDPGQITDVAAQHPEIVRDLQAHYDAYWATIEPSIAKVEPLVLRADPEAFTDLTSNSWVEVDCDNRSRVAEACGPPQGGVWQVEAQQAGDYTVTLSRWPFHLGRRLMRQGPSTTIGGLPISPGKALAIAAARLSVDGSAPVTAKAGANASTVSFQIALTQGRHSLQGWFQDASGADLAGAYFGRVRLQ